MTRRLLTAATAAIAATAFTGCGSTDDPRDDVRAAVHTWFGHIVHGRGADACELMTPEGRLAWLRENDALSGLGTCEEIATFFAGGLTQHEKEAFGRMKFREIAVRDREAVIEDDDVELPPELATGSFYDDRPMVLRRQRGDWLIAEVG